MAQGGYRQPASPSPVAMPGRLSGRTDGGPADPDPLRGSGAYGESKELAGLQSGAPMQSQREPFLAPFSGPGLADPSGRPEEPVTQGADAGPGAGTDALGLSNEDASDLQAILPSLWMLEWLANQPNAMQSTRNMIRRLKSEI